MTVRSTACILKSFRGDSTVKVVKGHDMGRREQENTESIGAFRCQLINVWNVSDAVINTIHFFIHLNP